MNQREDFVELIRGDLTESVHSGMMIMLAPDGSVAGSAGDVTSAMYPRSSSKLMQAAAMVRLGLELEPRLLALVASSHSGGDIHEAGARVILEKYKVPFNALRCTPFMPLGYAEKIAYRKAGGEAASIRSDCSGKHAGFLATCMINGWDLDTYLEPTHPLQIAIAEELSLLSGDPVTHTTIDGCGAPLLAITLSGLARAFRAGVVSDETQPVRQVADAMRAHPVMVGGVAREVTVAMQSLPGLLAKDGAECVIAMSMSDGRACAFKIADGGQRAVAVTTRAILEIWGADPSVLDQMKIDQVLGGGKPVGQLRATELVRELAGRVA
jgi:L-asparaginase II